ncbi:MAG: hypothetical protein EOO61_01860 [Hymenobacter sp.]|nr:MAG: hypothetical protein EOO61_01860 [Hymenobacter sp.]
MTLRAQVLAYIQAPLIGCNGELAAALAQAGWHRLTKESGLLEADYNISNCLNKFQNSVIWPPLQRLVDKDTLLIDPPDFSQLADFYAEHGLEPLSTAELEATQVAPKLQHALTLLSEVAPAYACVSELVKTIQVLRQPDVEIDVSYSHPAIPFSVFVTVCSDNSLGAALRVAEALLHETMHLKLTLLEHEVALLKPNSQGLYYSPWRDENRPARGILHGLFVFRAIYDFYCAFATSHTLPTVEQDFVAWRIEMIESELASLAYFVEVSDLTDWGKVLVNNLLKLQIDVNNPLLLLRKAPSASDMP